MQKNQVSLMDGLCDVWDIVEFLVDSNRVLQAQNARLRDMVADLVNHQLSYVKSTSTGGKITSVGEPTESETETAPVSSVHRHLLRPEVLVSPPHQVSLPPQDVPEEEMMSMQTPQCKEVTPVETPFPLSSPRPEKNRSTLRETLSQPPRRAKTAGSVFQTFRPAVGSASRNMTLTSPDAPLKRAAATLSRYQLLDRSELMSPPWTRVRNQFIKSPQTPLPSEPLLHKDPARGYFHPLSAPTKDGPLLWAMARPHRSPNIRTAPPLPTDRSNRPASIGDPNQEANANVVQRFLTIGQDQSRTPLRPRSSNAAIPSITSFYTTISGESVTDAPHHLTARSLHATGA